MYSDSNSRNLGEHRMLRVTPRQLVYLKLLAKEKETSFSAVVRQAIDIFLEKEMQGRDLTDANKLIAELLLMKKNRRRR